MYERLNHVCLLITVDYPDGYGVIKNTSFTAVPINFHCEVNQLTADRPGQFCQHNRRRLLLELIDYVLCPCHVYLLRCLLITSALGNAIEDAR